MRTPSKRRVEIEQAIRRGLGHVCFGCGTVTRSQSLRALGLRAVAERAVRHGRMENAARHANEFVDWAKQNPRHWDCGNAMHHGHIALGMIALKQGDLDRAGVELLAAAQTLGSPQLNSFGPSMQLAECLLLAGRTEVVLGYLDRYNSFWQMGRIQLKEWATQIRDGVIPSFGANLVY